MEEGGMLGRASHGAGCYSFKAKQLQPHLRAHPKQSGSRDWIAAPMKDLTPDSFSSDKMFPTISP